MEVKDDVDPKDEISDIMSEILEIPDGDDSPTLQAIAAIDNMSDSTLVTTDDIEVKKEELEGKKGSFRFTSLEDSFIRTGVERHGKSKSKWADILKDPEYTFHPSRTRDTLRMRAGTLKIGKKGGRGKKK